MPVRLVRCPFCSKRFNIAGIAAGTRLRCGGCTAVLHVPDPAAAPESRLRFTRSGILQVVGGIAAGLIGAVALYVALRPSPPGSTAYALAPASPPPVARIPQAAPEEKESAGPSDVIEYGPVMRRVREEFGERFFFREAWPYFIALEPGERFRLLDAFGAYARCLETVHRAFRKEFAEPLGLPEAKAPLLVLVFNSRSSFDRYCEERDGKPMHPSIKGVYEYHHERIVVYHDEGEVPFDVLYHEGSHQLVHHYTIRQAGRQRGTSPRTVQGSFWFQEGLGAYFEGVRPRDAGFAFDPGAGRDRLPTLKQALHPQGPRREFVPLSVLVGLTVDDFWKWFKDELARDPIGTPNKARLYYAESWALVHFLRHEGGNHRNVFDAYFERELQERGGKEAFLDFVKRHLEIELPELEERFVQYIRKLQH
jgi:hypothetical protein